MFFLRYLFKLYATICALYRQLEASLLEVYVVATHADVVFYSFLETAVRFAKTNQDSLCFVLLTWFLGALILRSGSVEGARSGGPAKTSGVSTYPEGAGSAVLEHLFGSGSAVLLPIKKQPTTRFATYVATYVAAVTAFVFWSLAADYVKQGFRSLFSGVGIFTRATVQGIGEGVVPLQAVRYVTSETLDAETHFGLLFAEHLREVEAQGTGLWPIGERGTVDMLLPTRLVPAELDRHVPYEATPTPYEPGPIVREPRMVLNSKEFARALAYLERDARAAEAGPTMPEFSVLADLPTRLTGLKPYGSAGNQFIVVDPVAFLRFSRAIEVASKKSGGVRISDHSYSLLPFFLGESLEKGLSDIVGPLFVCGSLFFMSYLTKVPTCSRSDSRWFFYEGVRKERKANLPFSSDVFLIVYFSFVVCAAAGLCIFFTSAFAFSPEYRGIFIRLGRAGTEVLTGEFFRPWEGPLRQIQQMVQTSGFLMYHYGYTQSSFFNPEQPYWSPYWMIRMGQHFEFLLVDINCVLVRTLKTVPFTMGLFEAKFFGIIQNPHIPSVFTDGLSYLLVWLTGVVCFAAHVVLVEEDAEDLTQQSLQVFFVALFSVFCFYTSDFLVFFVSFEMILLPLFLMIGLFGSRPERVGGAFFLLIYTLVGSLFLWPVVLYCVVVLDTSNFFDMVVHASSMGSGMRMLLWCCLLVGFAFKVPVVPVHLWLTVAHVEAPTVGSMLLAGLILKLGGYGILRFACSLFPVESLLYHSFVIGICCLGYTWATVMATRQVDIKRFVAFTSISHMNFALAVLFTMKEAGFGAFCHTMVSHGVIAAGMFGLVGFIYRQTSYRDIVHLSGLAGVAPAFALCWFILSMANVGLPFFSGFPGEFFGLIALAAEGRFAVLCFFLGFYLSAVYAFVSVSRLLYGSVRSSSVYIYDLTAKAQQVFGMLCFLSVTLGLLPSAVFSLAPLGSGDTLVEAFRHSALPVKKRLYCYVDPSFTNYLESRFGIPSKPSEIFGANWLYRELDYFPYTEYVLDPFASTCPRVQEKIYGVLHGPDAERLNNFLEARIPDYHRDFEQNLSAIKVTMGALKDITFPFRQESIMEPPVSRDDLVGKEVSSLVHSSFSKEASTKPQALVGSMFQVGGFLHRMTFHSGPGTYHPVIDRAILRDHNGVYNHIQLNNRGMFVRRSWTGSHPIMDHHQFFVMEDDRIVWDKLQRVSQSPAWFKPKTSGRETRMLCYSREYGHWYDLETGQLIPRLGRKPVSGRMTADTAQYWLSHFQGVEHARIVDFRGQADYYIRASKQWDPMYSLIDHGLMYSTMFFREDWYLAQYRS